MSVLVVPPSTKDQRWPTLGPKVCAWIEKNLVFGPGDLRGEQAVLDNEKRGLLYRMYEVYPKGHPEAGRRRFGRVAISLRKGSAKTELAAWIAAAELHELAPVRCVGWDPNGEPIGAGVTDPYIPLVAYTEEQSEELCYGALLAILAESPIVNDFDLGLTRILRADGTGRCVALANAPSARDGARTTFQVFDECLALDTPIMTTRGWSTMGEIKVGDFVYGRDGRRVRVEGHSPIHKNRACYRVTFSDGDSIVTDAGHLWRVTELSNLPAGEVERTTEQMFKAGIDTTYGKRWRLPRDNGYDGKRAKLPIDPYMLGVWLGDGSSDAGYIHAGVADVKEMMSLVKNAGFAIVSSKTTKERLGSNLGFRPEGLCKRLRVNGLLGNKHITPKYMLADRQQRLALLQGLMDTDGHATKTGHCTFTQGKRDFAESVAALVRSLGTPATITSQVSPLSRTGEMCYVHFSPTYCPFRLARKKLRCPGRKRVSWWPKIVSIEPVASVPVRCISVDSPDHLFLAGPGLRLTHNTHRLVLPKQKQAHRTMLANLPKRKLADAWSLETTTAFSPGENSVAEDTMDYARMVRDGAIADSKLFFFHRQAGDKHKELITRDQIRAAVVEASGPVGEWSNITGIVDQWQDPKADKTFLERVWLNRPIRSAQRAFDVDAWKALAREGYMPAKGAFVTLGFDGSRFHDATALVGTEVESGFQFLLGLWEKPPEAKNAREGEDAWSVPVDEVNQAVAAAFEKYHVWRMYADPPHWESHVDAWAGKFGEDKVAFWWTNRNKPMAQAVQAFNDAFKAGEISNDGNEDLARHIGNAVRKELQLRNDQGQPLWVIQKERPDSIFKMDGAMAAILSWEARGDAIKSGAEPEAAPAFQMLFFTNGSHK